MCAGSYLAMESYVAWRRTPRSKGIWGKCPERAKVKPFGFDYHPVKGRCGDYSIPFQDGFAYSSLYFEVFLLHPPMLRLACCRPH